MFEEIPDREPQIATIPVTLAGFLIGIGGLFWVTRITAYVAPTAIAMLAIATTSQDRRFIRDEIDQCPAYDPSGFNVQVQSRISDEALTGPLRDLRVIDMTQDLAGPFGTMMLSDFGAEVIKIERPDGGDETRS